MSSLLTVTRFQGCHVATPTRVASGPSHFRSTLTLIFPKTDASAEMTPAGVHGRDMDGTTRHAKLKSSSANMIMSEAVVEPAKSAEAILDAPAG